METDTLFTEITTKLHQWNGRRRLRDGLLWVPRGVLVGLLWAVVVATLARLRPLLTSQEVTLVAIGLVILGTTIALIYLFLQSKRILLCIIFLIPKLFNTRRQGQRQSGRASGQRQTGIR